MASVSSSTRTPAMLLATGPISLLTLMADVIRVPEECLAMSFLYLNRYIKFYRSQGLEIPLDQNMLALASLSLASKATEASRRLRDILLPAWRLMQQNKPDAKPLIVPSETYDALRAALVQTELILLRVLKFELRILLAFEFIPSYLKRTVGVLNSGEGGWGGTDDYDHCTQEIKESGQIASFMETGVAKACTASIVEAYKDYQLANFFTARTIAAACLYVTLRKRGLFIQADIASWLRSSISRSIDVEDFEDAVSGLQKLE
ncbi:uncharacterized protein K452DRAFT_359124 [Aplosporella prunicola CBS 121167]|uniref:RNA polymerase II holoenzyme cyclin-like subunit n=1 Tax=Aplosporella prunicola CBS 121167 TaxID=1176127 RepID=A0A6A6BB70_9PEZI|nr:uncharacterized protein K452DRAFT_359124 [Aplosporella prunicola CBS 121167]KAF2141350.1 hypothetical protein K452DRAFT_359124 [Aplosporella prunicola CBS 121167]